MQQTRGTSAVASLVLGIVALVVLLPSCFLYGVGLLLPLILGILAWIFGKNAMNAIDAGIGNPNERGMAVAGYRRYRESWDLRDLVSHKAPQSRYNILGGDTL
jgi:hypothetical protein